MGDHLGVDLGTTYTAAAVWRDRHVEITGLGNRAPTIPSVVLLRDDGSMLVGEAAERRAAVEPHRVAREFKRRNPAGMIGVNVGVAAPVAFFPFSGHRSSFFGDLHVTGRDGVEFFTTKKTTTTRWF